MPGRSSHRLEPLHLAFAGLGGLILFFVVAPLLGMALNASPHALREAAADPQVRASIGLTLWTAMAATLAVAVAAIPLAYLLARRDFALKGLVTAIVDLPIVIPHSAAGIALLAVVSRESAVGQVAEAAGLSIVNGPLGIMLAMAFVSLPFLVNAAREGFEAVPERLEKAALTLGASPTRVFFTIALPLAWRAIVSGFILMWARGMSEFGAVVIIAYQPMVAPILVWERFGAYGLTYARPVAVLFVAVCLILFVALRLVAGRRRNADR